MRRRRRHGHRSPDTGHVSRKGKFGNETKDTVSPCSHAEDTTTRAEDWTKSSSCSSYIDSGIFSVVNADTPASAVTDPHLSSTRSGRQTASTAISNESIKVYFGPEGNHKSPVEASRANSSVSSAISVSTPTPRSYRHQPKPSSGLRFSPTQPVRPKSPTSSATTIETSNPWSEQRSLLSTIESGGHEMEAKPPALPERPFLLSTLIRKSESEAITFQLDPTTLQKARNMLNNNRGRVETSIISKQNLPMMGSIFVH